MAGNLTVGDSMPLADATSASKNMQLLKTGPGKQTVRTEHSDRCCELACRDSYSGVC